MRSGWKNNIQANHQERAVESSHQASLPFRRGRSVGLFSLYFGFGRGIENVLGSKIRANALAIGQAVANVVVCQLLLFFVQL